MSLNFLSPNPSKTEFLVFGLPQQLSEHNDPTIHLPNSVILSPVDSARNLGVTFDKNLWFAQHISAVSKSCFHNIRHLLRRICNTTYWLWSTLCLHYCNFSHSSKIYFCNSLLLNLLQLKQIVFNLFCTLPLMLLPILINFITLILLQF